MKYINHICFFVITFVFCFNALGQDRTAPLQSYEILSTDFRGKPTFIDFISTKISSNNKSVYNFLKGAYNFDENTTFTTYLEKPFLKNGSFIRKQDQYYKGYKVMFSQIIMTYKNNQLLSLSANILPIQDYTPIISISESEALQIALQDMDAKEYTWQNEFEQNSLRRRNQDPKATYYATQKTN